MWLDDEHPESQSAVADRVRAACSWVASRSRSVRVETRTLEIYLHTLPAEPPPSRQDPATELVEADRESLAAFHICLSAINFGSGWWPTIRKRPARSGYFTIAAGLTERFREGGAWTAEELTRISAADVAAALGQESDHPLMALYATSLQDVGERVLGDHEGSFEAVVDAADGSALGLVDLLAGWQSFADTSAYDDRPVPFFKRAQLAAAELDRAGIASLSDLDRLTAFADNLVPHVLRLDGVLRLDPGLEEAIDEGELLPHGSPEEVELRACAVHAVELLSMAVGGRLSSATIDNILWNRGAEMRYKETPRPRSRSTAY